MSGTLMFMFYRRGGLYAVVPVLETGRVAGFLPLHAAYYCLET